jgi:hypothetical protein
MTWLEGKKRNNAATHGTVRRVMREKKAIPFVAMGLCTIDFLGKKVWVPIEKNWVLRLRSHLPIVRHRRHYRHGSRKNDDGLAECPHPAAVCPHPAVASSTLLSFRAPRRRRRQRLRCDKEASACVSLRPAAIWLRRPRLGPRPSTRY